MKRIIPLIVLAMLLASGSAWAADATATVDLNSAYVWRGYTFNDGLVAQPSIDVTNDKGLGINVWGNFDLDDYNGAVDENNFSEVDLTLSYSHSFNKLDTGVGIIEYLFPAGLPGTREIYGSLGYPIIGGFSAGLTIYYDVDEIHDYYADVAVDYSYDFSEALNLGIGASISYCGEDWANFYANTTGLDSGFHDYKLYASISYTINDAWSVGANINYTDSADDNVLPDENVDVKTFGGISASYSF